MSQELADSLNLPLAWSRLRFDRPDRCFLSHPFLLELIESNVEGWFENVRRRLIQGYAASPSLVVQVPKGAWQVRPGSNLRLEDELVLNAIVGRYLQNIDLELRELQGIQMWPINFRAEQTGATGCIGAFRYGVMPR